MTYQSRARALIFSYLLSWKFQIFFRCDIQRNEYQLTNLFKYKIDNVNLGKSNCQHFKQGRNDAIDFEWSLAMLLTNKK